MVVYDSQEEIRMRVASGKLNKWIASSGQDSRFGAVGPRG